MFDYTPKQLVTSRLKVQKDHPEAFSSSGGMNDYTSAQAIQRLQLKLKKHQKEDTLNELIRSLTRFEWHALPILLNDPNDWISKAALTCLEADPSRLTPDQLWGAYGGRFRMGRRDERFLDRLVDLIVEHTPPAENSWQLALVNASDLPVEQRALKLLDWCTAQKVSLTALEERADFPKVATLVLTIHSAALLRGQSEHWKQLNPEVAGQSFIRLGHKDHPKLERSERLKQGREDQLSALNNTVLNFGTLDIKLYTREELAILSSILREFDKPHSALYEAFLNLDEDHDNWLQYWRKYIILHRVESYDDGHERARFWQGHMSRMMDLTLIEGDPPILIADFEHFVVVDFCKVGNAAYLYERVDFNEVWLEYRLHKDHDTLKDRDTGERLLHFSGWQQNFNRKINDALGEFGVPNVASAPQLTKLIERARERGELRPLNLPKPPPDLEMVPLIPADPSKEDLSQLLVINSDPSARLIVEAPPGHGKTHTACERIISLLDQGVAPHQILVVSFTRVAVRALRLQLKRRGVEQGIDISTIDQLGFVITQGKVERRGDYDASIREALAIMNEGSDIYDRYQHILVDEAQDIIGERAELIALLLQNLPESAGFTLFHDPAQAIYDWSYKPDPRDIDAPILRLGEALMRADAQESLGIQECPLTHLYRTAESELITLMEECRPLTLAAHPEHARTLHRQLLARANPFEQSQLQQAISQAPPRQTKLILFKSRVEVMRTSQALLNAGMAHNLRLGGFPKPIAPWIALLVNHVSEERLSREAANQAWEELAQNPLLGTLSFDEAWDALLELGGTDGGLVNVQLVARRLSNSSIPSCVATSLMAQRELTVSTIHSSKGLEAEHVYFAVPPNMHWERKRAVEQARELYVGLSRAQHGLSLYKAGAARAGTNYRQRPWQRVSKSVFGVIAGIEGDVDLRQGLGIEQGDDATTQTYLSSWHGDPIALQPVPVNQQARTLLTTIEGIKIGALSAQLPKDVSGIAFKRFDKSRVSQRDHVEGLWWIDVVTVCAPYGSSTSKLRQPYQRTHMWLAPAIAGILEVNL